MSFHKVQQKQHDAMVILTSATESEDTISTPEEQFDQLATLNIA